MDTPDLFARARMERLSADSANIATDCKPDDRGPIISRGESQGDSPPGRMLFSSGRYICFGPFRVDQRRQELSRDGSRVRLQGKVYQALLTLLERPCEIITREELRVRLWPADTHVNYDANVNTTVNKLRRALGDSSDDPVYIETIPKRGYCLLVRPEVSNAPGDSQSFEKERPAEEAEAASPIIAAPGFSRCRRLWIILGVIGLILAGMLLGARIMRVWISHPTSGTRVVGSFESHRGRGASCFFTAPSMDHFPSARGVVFSSKAQGRDMTHRRISMCSKLNYVDWPLLFVGLGLCYR